LINNRQGGRRRGRGGQQAGRNLGGQPGNRQDNRQRGNAAQLLEKYKSMARDSQLAGDRVQTEYYLQYADHYFRVLGESRARFDDQRRPRGDEMDEDGDDEDFVEAGEEQGSDDRPERPERQERPERPERTERPERVSRPNPDANARDRDRNRDRDRAPAREPRRFNRDERSAGDSGEQADSRAEMNGRDDSLPLDVLPPAIGADAPASMAADDEAPAPKPRRRARPARPPEGEDDIAPAA
jgi:hypothetical protein